MNQTPKRAKPKSRTLSTVIGVALTIVLVPILVVNLSIIVQSFARPNEVPGFFGYKPLIVLSGSMQPMIEPGDLVVVEKVSAGQVEKGDVIAYLRGGIIITHRVMEISDTGGARNFYTKGDNNNVDDGMPVTADMLQGRYLFKIPGAGRVAMFMQTPIGMALFIVLPLMAFVAYDMTARRRASEGGTAETKRLEEELAAVKQRLVEAEAKKDSESQTESDDPT